MELGKLLIAFFIVVIILALISLLPSGQSGQFIISSPHLESAFIIIAISIIVIFIIKVPKKYYRPIPSRA